MQRISIELLFVLLACAVIPTCEAAERKLNVLFLISDDMRPDLTCYGNTTVSSPNIDALAKAGVRFQRAYAQYPLCNPSRTSLLTGRYPDRTGVMDNKSFFGTKHAEFVSLPKHFKANGYVTLRTGKIFHEGIDDADAWTEGGESQKKGGGRIEPAGCGEKPKSKAPSSKAPPADSAAKSDRAIVLSGDGESHVDYKVADRAIEYLRQKKDKPFFLACGFVKPHAPPTAPKKYYELYDAAKLPLPPDFAATPTVPPGFPKECILPRNSDLFVGRPATQEAAQEMIRAYYASISWTDWNVGRVIGELDRLSLRDSTIIVFWGDHGYHLGEKGKWSKHQSLFEVATRVPFIIAAPGARGNGQACDRITEVLGLYPTLCDLCGVEKPRGLEGRSLAPLLADPAAAWDHPAFMVSGNNGRLLGSGIRTTQFHYVEYVGGGAMLFDESKDPAEMKNLANDPKFAAPKSELSGKLKAFLER